MISYLWAELDVETEIWIQSFINGEPRAHKKECVSTILYPTQDD
jgi:hypothetical protein